MIGEEAMNTRLYLFITGIIFGIVAVLHLLRVVNQWDFQLGPWLFPMWVSWLGALVPALLSVWAFYMVSRPR
jgi:undecaprenyl pyrophosphate phosphatase UppP